MCGTNLVLKINANDSIMAMLEKFPIIPFISFYNDKKTISLSEHAYNLLKKEKMEDESFSKVIERMLSKKDNPWRLM